MVLFKSWSNSFVLRVFMVNIIILTRDFCIEVIRSFQSHRRITKPTIREAKQRTMGPIIYEKSSSNHKCAISRPVAGGRTLLLSVTRS